MSSVVEPVAGDSFSIASRSTRSSELLTSGERTVENMPAGPVSGIQPCARSATRRSVSLALPPIQIGIGICTGRGRPIVPRQLKCVPW